MERFANKPFITRKENSKDSSNNNQPGFLDNALRWLTAGYLFLLPVFFVPTPWGVFEHSRGVLTLAAGVIIGGLSLIKIFSNRRFEFSRNLTDLAVLGVFVSILMATLFSNDFQTSLWGYDHRLGSGFVVLSTLILLGYLLRQQLKEADHLALLMRSFVWGLGLSALVSLFGTVGTDLYGSIFNLELMVSESIPLVGPSNIAVVTWFIGIIMTIALIAMGSDRKYSLIHLISVNLLGFAVILFSMGISFVVIALLLLVMAGMTLLFMGRRSVESNSASRWVYAIFGVMAVGLLVVRIPQVTEGLRSVVNISQQVPLDGETTWQISIKSLADTVKTGFFGFGLDTFPVIYNAYRPMFMGDYDLSNVTYSGGSSEFLTIVGTRGLVGTLLWLGSTLVIGLYVSRVISGYLKGEYSLTHAILSVGLITLMMLSFFMTFGLMIMAVLVFLIAFIAVIETINSPRDVDYFVIQVDLQSERVARASREKLNLGIAIAIGIVMAVLLVAVGRLFTSSIYGVKAENYLAQKRSEITAGNEYTGEEQRAFTSKALDYYGKAISYDEGNSYLYRRSATLVMTYVESQVNELSDNGSSNANLDEISQDLDKRIKNALKISEKVVDLAPAYYKSWDVHTYVLVKMVAYGYSQYRDDAYSAMDIALRLSPNNPGLYYNVALMYESEGKYSEALNAVEQGLNLRLDLEPVLLAAQLNIELDDPEKAVQYLQATMAALDEAGAKDSNIYLSISQRLNEVKSAIVNDNVDSLKRSNQATVGDTLEVDNPENVVESTEADTVVEQGNDTESAN